MYACTYTCIYVWGVGVCCVCVCVCVCVGGEQQTLI